MNSGTFSLFIKTLLILGILMTVLDSHARSFTKVGATKGLEAKVVPSMLVDSEGLLWVASREGLFRYDGYRATAFLPDARRDDAITDLDIRWLHEAQNGDIWIGTSNGGLNRYHRNSGKFSHFRNDPANENSLPDDTVYGISEGPQGHIWVTTQKGLAQLDSETGNFEVFRHDPGQPNSLSSDWPLNLHRGQSGQLWISTIGGGVNRWNPETRDFSRFSLAELTGGPAKRDDIFTLWEAGDGRVWAGTREGLVILDPVAGTAEYVDLGNQEGVLPVIAALYPVSDKQLWLGTMLRGVLVVDIESGQWSELSSKPLGTPGALPKHPQMSFAVTAGQVFIGTWGEGVFRTPLLDSPFSLVNRDSLDDKLRMSNISAVMGTSRPAEPWLGTFGGGPQRVNLAKKQVIETQGNIDQIRHSGVLDITRDSSGRLFAATSRGLFQFDETGAEISLDKYSPDKVNGIGDGYVYAVLPANDGNLWVGLFGSGLFLRDGVSGSYQSYGHDKDNPESVSGNSITDIVDGRDGFIWVGTRSNGLNRCRIDNWACERFSGRESGKATLNHYHITALKRDRRGRLWVATGGGLHLVLQNENGEVTGFENFTRANGILNDSIMGIEEDLDESLWLSTRHGLSRFNPATGAVVNFVPESGLPSSHFNTNASGSDTSYIYFGSVAGLVSIAKGSLLQTRQPAPVRITRIQTAAKDESPTIASPSEGVLNVPFGQIITMEFASLDFSETAHDYAYRLRPGDPWTQLSDQRQMIFYGIAPGVYDFQARGRDVYGLWAESDPLKLAIIPPFWMTTWFRLLAAFLMLGMMLAWHQLRISRQRRSARESQRLSEKRESVLEEALGSEAELKVLTPRQKEILQLIAEGFSTREIADLLSVSVKTVEAHRANLMERVDIHDVAGLVRLAIRARLVSSQE